LAHWKHSPKNARPKAETAEPKVKKAKPKAILLGWRRAPWLFGELSSGGGTVHYGTPCHAGNTRFGGDGCVRCIQCGAREARACNPSRTAQAFRSVLRYPPRRRTEDCQFVARKAGSGNCRRSLRVVGKVVRKLRAGLMPPPGVRRPPLAEYEGLRDYLEAEIDRKAASRSNPGSVVMHRLNRTEYANSVRDLLDLEIDTTTLLPPDDSARGFDNVTGSLTISPTLR
jgi:hypothetical protein